VCGGWTLTVRSCSYHGPFLRVEPRQYFLEDLEEFHVSQIRQLLITFVSRRQVVDGVEVRVRKGTGFFDDRPPFSNRYAFSAGERHLPSSLPRLVRPCLRIAAQDVSPDGRACASRSQLSSNGHCFVRRMDAASFGVVRVRGRGTPLFRCDC